MAHSIPLFSIMFERRPYSFGATSTKVGFCAVERENRGIGREIERCSGRYKEYVPLHADSVQDREMQWQVRGVRATACR